MVSKQPANHTITGIASCAMLLIKCKNLSASLPILPTVCVPACFSIEQMALQYAPFGSVKRPVWGDETACFRRPNRPQRTEGSHLYENNTIPAALYSQRAANANPQNTNTWTNL